MQLRSIFTANCAIIDAMTNLLIPRGDGYVRIRWLPSLKMSGPDFFSKVALLLLIVSMV